MEQKNIIPLSDRVGKIWMNGELLDSANAKISVLSHSLHYGLAVFEGLRAYESLEGKTNIFRLQEHTQRLFESAKILQINVPFNQDTLNEAQISVVRTNRLKSAYIRPIIFLGSEKLGIKPTGNRVHVAIAAWEWGAYLGENGIQNGIRIKTSSFTRHHVNITMVRAKASANYVNSILAHQEVTADGYDEALILDTEGYVSEGSGENIFIVRNNKLFTPDLANCLAGITRSSVMQIAKDLGIQTIEKRISRDELYTADEAFFTGTAAEITPIREVDRRIIGQGNRGPLTKQLQTMYNDIVRNKYERYSSWLTNVS